MRRDLPVLQDTDRDSGSVSGRRWRNMGGDDDSGPTSLRGITAKFYGGNASPIDMPKVGDRMCQLLVMTMREPEMLDVDRLPETARGAGGFGSTGR